MGVTGSGKSFFINKLAGSEVVQEGASLDSCKQISIFMSDLRLNSESRHAVVPVGTNLHRPEQSPGNRYSGL